MVAGRKHDAVSAYMRRTGLTLRGLAKQLGISPGYLSQIRSGKRRPSLDTAFDIEDATGIPARSFRSRRRGA
jgi:transcriptional regulator with XRE-family HTH domain